MCMNRKLASIMANKVREMIGLLEEANDYKGKYLKVKVKIDIRKPLRRVLKLCLDGSIDMGKPMLVYMGLKATNLGEDMGKGKQALLGFGICSSTNLGSSTLEVVEVPIYTDNMVDTPPPPL